MFKVCDQPHPVLVKDIIKYSLLGDVAMAVDQLTRLWNQGFSGLDIITTIFKVVKTYDMPEPKKLDFIKEIGTTHMRVLEGVDSLLQLSGLVARLNALK